MTDLSYPFVIRYAPGATSALFTTDNDVDNQPQVSIGYTNANTYGIFGPGLWWSGVLKSVGVCLTPTNAVTYRLAIYEQPLDGVELQSVSLFRSYDNEVEDVAACASGVDYVWRDLDVPFFLLGSGDGSDFWINIDWSAAPGDTTGYITLRGLRESSIR